MPKLLLDGIKFNVEKSDHKEKLLEYIRSYEKPDKIMRNRMGCDESWYDPYYSIKKSFDIEELENMTEDQIYNLVVLATNIGSALY